MATTTVPEVNPEVKPKTAPVTLTAERHFQSEGNHGLAESGSSGIAAVGARRRLLRLSVLHGL